MDNVTHSLLAVTLSRTALRRVGSGTTATLLLASNIPDVDFVAAFSSREGAYLAVHRGPTHGPIGIVVLAALTAALVRFWPAIVGRKPRHGPGASMAGLLAVALIGTTIHVLMDLPTSYGTRLLSPFIATWFTFDWLPIIDPYLLLILVSALVAFRFNPRAAPRTATVVLLAVVAHYTVRATLHDVAIDRAGGAQPLMRLDTWSSSPLAEKLRPCGPSSQDGDGSDQRLTCGVVALPTFLSPFEWRILKRFPGGYEVSAMDLLGRPARHAPIFYETARGVTIDEALQNPRARVFMAFARLPVAQLVRAEGDDLVVGLQDLRFVGEPAGANGVREPRPGPFSIVVHVNRRAVPVSE